MVDLCVVHLRSVPKAVKEMQALRHEDQRPLIGLQEETDDRV